MVRARAVAPGLDYCNNLEEALTGVDCAIIATEWQQFVETGWRELRPLMDAPVVIDLRNLLVPDRMRAWGFVYEALGRPALQLSEWELVERTDNGGSGKASIVETRRTSDRGTSALP
jgi:UDPglucose 6-dehydrogenase